MSPIFDLSNSFSVFSHNRISTPLKKINNAVKRLFEKFLTLIKFWLPSKNNIDLFWNKKIDSYTKIIPKEYFLKIYNQDSDKMKLKTDIERCTVILDGSQLARDKSEALEQVDVFFKKKFSDYDTNKKKRLYLQALFTQGMLADTAATIIEHFNNKYSEEGIGIRQPGYKVYAGSEGVILKYSYVPYCVETGENLDRIDLEMHAPFNYDACGKYIFSRPNFWFRLKNWICSGLKANRF
jgi:hypothetical protein